MALCLSSYSLADSMPRADAGEMDLSHWDFEQDGNVRLDGYWQFYWKEFISPEHGGHPGADTILVPGAWNSRKRSNAEEKPNHGYASYQLRVSLPSNTPRLALKMVDIGEAFRLYVNGVLLHSGGEVGTNERDSVPEYSRSVLLLPTDGADELNIVIHVSNYHYRSGGLWDVITLGEVSAIQNSHERALGYAIFLAGSIGFIAVYHFGLYLQRRQDLSPLYFSLFCLAVFMRILVTDERYINQVMPSISYSMLVRIEYLSFLLGVPAFAGFIANLIPDYRPKWALKFCVIFGLLASAFVVATPVALFSEYLPLFQTYLLISVCFGVYVFIRNLMQQREVAGAFLFGFVVLAVAIFHDVLMSMDVIKTPVFLAGAGMLFFILIQSYSLSLRFANSFSQVEALSQKLEGYTHTLESKVEQRTRELEAANRQLEKLVSVDGLTGIANRRAFDELLKREWIGHARRSSHLAMILLDIDYFKPYNDSYGHLEGDDALRKVAQCLSDALQREVDTVARYGGEEFAIVLPDTNLEGALKIAERVKDAVYNLNIPHRASPVSDRLTFSCGVAETVPTEALKPEDLIALADSALYRAKEAGRDTVVASPSAKP
ncbi:Phytochrome-like protein cph2 [Halioglobus japonicus]|nr:Phytochrome-like protein cph2 [Halioglobus japonicus]